MDPEKIQKLGDQYLRAVEADSSSNRFTDKMPLNYRHLGLIHVALPNARIVHIRRDRNDTCLSIYTTFFAGGPNFAYSQSNIATFYDAYLRLMEHWRAVLPAERFVEIDYEALVKDTEAVVRGLLDWLGLPWDEACIHPERNLAQVATPSKWQARQPIYKGSIGRAKPYLAFFPDLFPRTLESAS